MILKKYLRWLGRNTLETFTMGSLFIYSTLDLNFYLRVYSQSLENLLKNILKNLSFLHIFCVIYILLTIPFFFQSLILLSYLVKNGSERVVTSAREHIYDLRRLESYTFTDENGKDQGLNGKQKNHFKKKYINNQNTIILTKTDLQDRDISWPAVLIK